MVPSPTQTKAPWRRKGWFTEHEEKIMVNRILRDDPSKSDMHNREAVTLKLLWEALCDFDLWPIYAIALVFIIFVARMILPDASRRTRPKPRGSSATTVQTVSLAPLLKCSSTSAL